MGTNFYLIHPIPQEKKEEFKRKVDSTDNLDEIYDAITEVFGVKEDYRTGDTNYRVHIGKRSCGWQFLFSRAIERHCRLTEKGIKKWLGTGKIVDEYGDEYTVEEFWKESVEGFKSGITSDEYYKEHPEERFRSYDYLTNGLRFTSDYRDFS